jgi:hypothetical protein
MRYRIEILLLAGLVLSGTGCLLAAAGAGAGGAIYVTDRGVQSLARTTGASEQNPPTTATFRWSCGTKGATPRWTWWSRSPR